VGTLRVSENTADPMRASSNARTLVVLLPSIVLLSFATSCQLLFGEFEVAEETPRPANGGASGMSAATGGMGEAATGGTVACQAGEVVCQGELLLECDNGFWNERQCASSAHCDATLGACRECLEGEIFCDDDKTLQSCDATTGRFVGERCADGYLCDMQSARCVLCLPGHARCAGDSGLEKCNPTQDGWELVPCPAGCVQNGLYDYCAAGAGGSASE